MNYYYKSTKSKHIQIIPVKSEPQIKHQIEPKEKLINKTTFPRNPFQQFPRTSTETEQVI